MTTGAPAPGATRVRRFDSRTLAIFIAAPALILIWIAALLVPVPYVVYTPGVTVDVLGSEGGTGDGEEIIEVSGHEVYRDDGQLRMTTVYVTQPEGNVSMFKAMWAWLSDEQAVLPYDQVYPEQITAEESRRESAVEMVSSQDAATAVALKELGYDVERVIQVLNVQNGMPADGVFRVRDVLVSVDGQKIKEPQDILDAVAKSGGKELKFQVERDGKPKTLSVTPRKGPDGARIGIVPGPGYHFPFQVTVNIDPAIGGPSAGLMFSLAIYDTLTPGSLTDGETIAGTGTIDEAGQVGRIGGIQQKIVAARDAGAELFLVPAGNCDEALGAPNEDMRLVSVETMPKALDAIENWVEDPDVDLPSCQDAS